MSTYLSPRANSISVRTCTAGQTEPHERKTSDGWLLFTYKPLKRSTICAVTFVSADDMVARARDRVLQVGLISSCGQCLCSVQDSTPMSRGSDFHMAQRVYRGRVWGVSVLRTSRAGTRISLAVWYFCRRNASFNFSRSCLIVCAASRSVEGTKDIPG